MTRTPYDIANDIRSNGNAIESALSSLMPDVSDSPSAYKLWERAMEMCAQQHYDSVDLMLMLSKAEQAAKLATEDAAQAAYRGLLGGARP